MTTEQSPESIVLAFHQAWTGGDVARAMEYVADDVAVHAPGTELPGRAAYGQYLEAFVPNLNGVPHIATLVDGDRVALFYYPQTDAASDVPAVEMFTVKEGKIVDNLLIFDRLSYGLQPQA